MLAVGHGAFWLFDRNEAVIGIGLRMISITFPFYVLYAVLEVQADVMRGLGNSVVPALIVLAILCVLRVVLVLAFGTSVESIAATYPITWFSTAVMLVAFRAIPAFRR
jgi:Na+-driven multidrug efflux pump